MFLHLRIPCYSSTVWTTGSSHFRCSPSHNGICAAAVGKFCISRCCIFRWTVNFCDMVRVLKSTNFVVVHSWMVANFASHTCAFDHLVHSSSSFFGRRRDQIPLQRHHCKKIHWFSESLIKYEQERFEWTPNIRKKEDWFLNEIYCSRLLFGHRLTNRER